MNGCDGTGSALTCQGSGTIDGGSGTSGITTCTISEIEAMKKFIHRYHSREALIHVVTTR